MRGLREWVNDRTRENVIVVKVCREGYWKYWNIVEKM